MSTQDQGVGVGVVVVGVVVVVGAGLLLMSRFGTPIGGRGGLDTHRERERMRDPEGFARRIRQSWDESPQFLRTPSGLAAGWDVTPETAQKYITRYGLR